MAVVIAVAARGGGGNAGSSTAALLAANVKSAVKQGRTNRLPGVPAPHLPSTPPHTPLCCRLQDLAEGRGLETLALEWPEARQRISYHPHSAPLHRIKTEDQLPLRLLTPFQAENDHHIKDTYNYVTVQVDAGCWGTVGAVRSGAGG